MRSVEAVNEQIAVGLCQHQKQGLVSPAVGDYPQLKLLQQGILEQGGTVSVASLRIDTLTAEDVAALQQSGHRTVALAPEAGSQKLRDAIRPGITETQLWSVLHQSVIEQNGDYCETRLLSAGARTNPWFQEAAHHVIGDNDLDPAIHAARSDARRLGMTIKGGKQVGIAHAGRDRCDFDKRHFFLRICYL